MLFRSLLHYLLHWTLVWLRKFRFDVLLNLHASAAANLISLSVRAKRKIGFDKERARDGQNWFCSESIKAIPNQHVAEGMMGFITQLNIQATSPKWRPLALEPEEDQVRAHIDTERLTCLISPCRQSEALPGCQDPVCRRWPDDMGRHLDERGRGILGRGPC